MTKGEAALLWYAKNGEWLRQEIERRNLESFHQRILKVLKK
ncbi:hypothetical protein [Bradyrhizobium genosp. P]